MSLTRATKIKVSTQKSNGLMLKRGIAEELKPQAMRDAEARKTKGVLYAAVKVRHRKGAKLQQ